MLFVTSCRFSNATGLRDTPSREQSLNRLYHAKQADKLQISYAAPDVVNRAGNWYACQKRNLKLKRN